MALGWFEGLSSRLTLESLAGCAVDVVAGAGGVVADLLGDEFFSLDMVECVVFLGLGEFFFP